MNVNNFAIHSQNQLGKSAFMVNDELTQPSAGALNPSAGHARTNSNFFPPLLGGQGQ